MPTNLALPARIFLPSITASTPLPAISLMLFCGGIFFPYSFFIAAAIGCDEALSARAAYLNKSGFWETISVTLKTPFVSVPVLSNTTTEGFERVSI